MRLDTDPRLDAWLRERAKDNFRTCAQEVSAILWAVCHSKPIETPAVHGKVPTPALVCTDLPAPNGEIVDDLDDVDKPTSTPTKVECRTEKRALAGYRSTSGYRGVYAYGKRWQAKFVLDGVLNKVGVFDTPEEAAQAWDDAQRQRFGDTGFYNFPREGEQGFPVVDDDDSVDPAALKPPSEKLGEELSVRLVEGAQHYFDKGSKGGNNGTKTKHKPGDGS